MWTCARIALPNARGKVSLAHMRIRAFHRVLLFGGLMSLAASARAEVTFFRELSPAQITSHTLVATTDPRGLAVTADGSTWYFFEDDTVDDLIRFSGNTLTTWVTRTQFETALSITGVVLLDMTVDPTSGNLFAIVRPAGTNTLERIVRIPSQGVVELVVATSDSEGADALDVDVANNRLVFVRTGLSGAAAGTAGLYSVSLTGTAATPSLISTEATIAAALTPNGTTLDASDLVVLSNGDIIVANAFNSSNTLMDGDLLRVTSTGVASIFADRALLLAAMSNPGGAVGEVLLEASSSDAIYLWHNGSTPPGEYLLLGTNNGATWTALASEAQMLADPAFLAALDVGADGNGIAMTAADKFAIATVDAGTEGIVSATGAEVTRVEDWTLR